MGCFTKKMTNDLRKIILLNLRLFLHCLSPQQQSNIDK